MRDQADPMRETPAGAVGASPMAGSLPRVLTISLVAGLFLGLTGPLGTIDLPLAVRVGYWMVACVGGSLLGWGATFVVMLWPRARDSAWLMILSVAVLMTPPGTVLVGLWGAMAVPGVEAFTNTTMLSWSVFVISLVMTAINRLIGPQPVASPAVAPTPSAPPPPAAPRIAFLDRLPPRLRGAALHAVEAEDHYLRVHTAKGSDLILLRLADALGELAALDGAQTHRSWWVAREAVRGVSKGDGRATLTLEGGLKVPVSRAHAATLRAAGWF